MHAYFMSRAGAKRLLEISIPLNENIDKQFRKFMGESFHLLCVVPEVGLQNWDLRNDRVSLDSIDQRRKDHEQQLLEKAQRDVTDL